MATELFLQGGLIGLAIAAPVGPIGVLCIQKTLARNRLHGLAAGLGAATADALYGLLAGLGITALTHLLLDARTPIQLGGGLFLCYLGYRTFTADTAAQAARVGCTGIGGTYLSTLLLTLANPVTILSFMAIFAGMGAYARGGGDTLMLVFGIFSGSAGWWLLLSGLADRFGRRLLKQGSSGLNRVSGALLAGFGLLALLSSGG